MKRFFTLSLLLLSALSLPTRSSAQATGENDYWIGFSGIGGYGYNLPEILLIADKPPVNVVIQYGSTTKNLTITSAGLSVQNLPWMSVHRAITNKAVHVYAPGGEPFKCSAFYGAEEDFSSTNCIPVADLGTCYRVIDYPSFDSISALGVLQGYYPSFCVVSTADNNQVTIEFPAGVGSLGTVNVTLNKGQAYWVDCGNSNDFPLGSIDPTGTRVSSTSKVAVFAGHSRASVPHNRAGRGNDGYCNPLFEQMIPVGSWGQLYHAVVTPRAPDDVYRILTDEDNTDVYIDGAKVATINAGKFYETLPLGEAHEIYSSKPTEVMEFITSPPGGGYAGWGPEMSVLPPVESYFARTTFKQRPAGIGSQHAIVIVPTAHDSVVRFNGTTLPRGNFTPIPKSFGTTEYSYAYISNISAAGINRLRYLSAFPDSNTMMAYLVSFDLDGDESAFQNVGYHPLLPQLALKQDTVDLLCSNTILDTMKFSNSGTGPLIISSPLFTGGSSFTFLSPTSFPDTIFQSQSHPYIVRFTNATPGVYTAPLTFQTNELDCHQLMTKSVVFTGHKERVEIARAPASVDFGTVHCLNYDTTLTITNLGTVPVTVDSGSFNDAGMKVLSPTLPKKIAPGSTLTITVRLMGGAIPKGVYNAALHVSSHPCDLTSDFTFTANKPSIDYAVSPASVDFGTTSVNKTSSSQLSFTNNSTATVRVGAAKFDSVGFPGTVTSPTVWPQFIAPGQSLTVKFSATPLDTISYHSNLRVYADSECIENRFIPVDVRAASFCPAPEPSGIVGKMPGDVVQIPIIVSPSTKFKDAKKIDLHITYDADLLRYGGSPQPTVGPISNVKLLPDGVSFTVTPSGPLPTRATLANIQVEALLATHSDGTIRVEASSITMKNDEVIMGKPDCPADFVLGSECVHPEMIQSASSAIITGIYPNPVSTSAKVVVKAIGNPEVLIEVFDTFGRKVEVVRSGIVAPGKHEIEIKTEKYANGMYFCRLINGSETSTYEFNVRK